MRMIGKLTWNYLFFRVCIYTDLASIHHCIRITHTFQNQFRQSVYKQLVTFLRNINLNTHIKCCFLEYNDLDSVCCYYFFFVKITNLLISASWIYWRAYISNLLRSLSHKYSDELVFWVQTYARRYSFMYAVLTYICVSSMFVYNIQCLRKWINI